MAAQRIGIMDIRQLLQLKTNHQSNRSCERILGIHRNTINYYVRQFKASGQSFQALMELSDYQLLELFPRRSHYDHDRYRQLSEQFIYFKKELLRPGATKEALWRDYLLKTPDGYGYTQFKEHLNTWLKQIKVSGKLQHKAGDKVYLDYCGKKLEVVAPETGVITEVEVFVAILPCSQYTYVEASLSQKRENFIESVNSCLKFFGGSPKAIVPDNLKSAVTKASKYEAIINKSLKALGLHYGSVINPTRSYSPQDKALVEGAVKLVYQRIFYPIRNMTFFSLEDLNRQIRIELDKYNNRLMSTLETSRLKQFLDVEKAYLQPLPPTQYQLKTYKRAKVQKMGYIYISEDKNYYSVPYRYISKSVEIQYNQTEVEIYYNTERIAFHKRSFQAGKYTTNKDHLSSTHRFYSNWSVEYFDGLAKKIGEHTRVYIKALIEQQQYPEIGYKQSLGIISLKKAYSLERIELACHMAIKHDHYSYRTISRILANKMDLEYKNTQIQLNIPSHDNIRKNYC
jgi:transposase